MAKTSAYVNIFASNNATLQDAFQFGVPGDVSWSFTGQHFVMDIKASRDDETPLLSLTDGAGEIVVDDVVQRVLHLNVPMSVLQSDLPVNDYVYDLIMFDESTPPIRVQLMQGRIYFNQGVTET